MLQFVPINP